MKEDKMLENRRAAAFWPLLRASLRLQYSDTQKRGPQQPGTGNNGHVHW